MMGRIIDIVSGAARRVRTTLVNIPTSFHTTSGGYVTLNSCVILPGRIHRDGDETYEYSDLNVTLTRHYINRRFDAMCEAAHRKGYSVLSPRQFFDLKELLESRRDVYHGTGQKINGLRVREILGDIFEAKEPFRGEWLDARFEDIEGVLYMASDHRTVSTGHVEPMYLQPVKDGYLEDECRISLSEINIQGLPTKRGKDAGYIPPKPSSESGTIVWANERGPFLSFSHLVENYHPDVGIRLAFRRS